MARGRKRERDLYAQQVLVIYEQADRSIRRTALRAQLEGLPTSESTVRTIIKEHPDVLDAHLEAPYTWPGSHLMGVLPWEASSDALDLMKFRQETGERSQTNRVTLWFHRLRVARPGIPVSEAVSLAGIVAAWDFTRRLDPESQPILSPGFEPYLAFAPWTDSGREAYDAALSREDDPIPGNPFRFTVRASKEQVLAMAGRMNAAIDATRNSTGSDGEVGSPDTHP